MSQYKLGRDDQLIPNACNCFDFHITRLKFSSQVRDMNVHCAGLTIKIEAPGLLQDLFTAEDESTVSG